MAQSVRIVTWNASQGVHGKLPTMVDRFQPDVAVVPECAAPDILAGKLGGPVWRSVAWVGRLQQKGLAVFSFGDFQLEEDPTRLPAVQWTIPVSITGPVSFSLLGVWAMNRRATEFAAGYEKLPTATAAFELYGDWLANRSVVVAGDFNHNAQWDKPSKTRSSWARAVESAGRVGLVSAYHQLTGDDQGREKVATHYFRKAEDARYHIDYVFAPPEWLEGDTAVVVGTYDDWVPGFSDHVPMVVDLKIPESAG